MQMAAYRTLLFRSHRSHSHVIEGESPIHASPISVSLSLCMILSLRLSSSPSVSLVLSEFADTFTYAHVCTYTRIACAITNTQRRLREPGDGNASIVRKRESTQFHERPRHNFVVNQVFSAIICGLATNT